MDGQAILQPMLTPPQKAAVIVRLLLAEGADLPLRDLPVEAQARLAQEMANMESIDRDTRDAVVAEFCDRLDSIGLTFPGDMGGALALLGDHLSQHTTNRLRRIAALTGESDPWDRILSAPTDHLCDIAMEEAAEVVAILISKLPVPKAAELFGRLPPERARQIAYAVSLTSGAEAEALRRVGMALMQALDARPQPVLEGEPVERVGAILNFTPSFTRDTVLDGLDQDDAVFAEQVRKAIFTWANIPQRVDARDVVRILKQVEQDRLVKALAGAKDDATAQFLLGNISQRMAETLREEVEAAGKVSAKDAEEAQTEVIAAIRSMEEAGELFLIAGEEE